ncbi:MAG: MATE family efflux transporter [Chloracidobacterium sp.]|uniref:Multidrug-efflux transporter n=1 Tax=Chloracidobacterium validum TaxID=2821543 RepID=A0ABX8B4I4_9BACT|nr:MATE family efflux transporter [Chloracidobacterium validum]QUW01887.1 MATE family efflux transporter [Chloracidobacterium validum]
MTADTPNHRVASHYTAHIKLALPVMFSQMGHLVVQMTDSIMLGHYDTTALAASSFGQSVFVVGLVFSIGFTLALTPLVGAARGANDIAAAARWLKNGAAINLAVGLLVTLLLLGAYPWLDHMGQTPQVTADAKPYYLLLVASLLPIVAFQIFRQFTEGLGNTRIAVAITGLEVLLNVGLNYALIFGNWGFPRLGIVGAGLATLAVRVAMPLAFALFFVKLSLFAPYRAALRQARWQMAAARQYLNLGVPLGGQFVLEVGAFAAGALMMGWLGEAAQAAHQIAIGIASFTFMGASGIAAATTIRVSHYLGAGEQRVMRAAGFAGAHVVLAYMGMTAVIILALRNRLPAIYTQDSAVISLSAKLLTFAAAFQVVDGLQVVMLAALRALTDAIVPTLLACVAYLLVTIPVSYGLAFHLGWREAGIWMGYVIGLALAAGMFFVRFHLLSRVPGQPPA